MNTEQDFQVMTPQEVMTRLDEVTENIVKEVCNLDNEEINFNSDVDEWSIKQILAHLHDVEEIFSERIKKILAEDEPFLPAFNPEELAEERNYQNQEWETILTTFKEIRQDNLRIFGELQPMQWGKVGIHEESGRTTLRDIGEKLVIHNEEHLEHIRHVIWLAK